MIDPVFPPAPSPDEVPEDPGTQKVIRRSLLFLALFGLLAPCGLCWYSTSVEAFELILIPSLLAVPVALYSVYVFYQREQKQDLAPPLWRVLLIFLGWSLAVGLALLWLLRAAGWRNAPGAVILGLGTWSLLLAGRRVWESWSFSRRSVEEENDLAVLDMISIRGSHPIYPQLVYRYAENYRGQLRSDRIHKYAAEIQAAIKQGSFRVTVQYLPENPRVHRLKGWRIIRQETKSL